MASEQYPTNAAEWAARLDVALVERTDAAVRLERLRVKANRLAARLSAAEARMAEAERQVTEAMLPPATMLDPWRQRVTRG